MLLTQTQCASVHLQGAAHKTGFDDEKLIKSSVEAHLGTRRNKKWPTFHKNILDFEAVTMNLTLPCYNLIMI